MFIVVMLLACASNDGFSGNGGGDRIDSLTGAIGGGGGGGGDTTDTSTTTETTTGDTGFTTTTTSGCGPSDLTFTLEAQASDGIAYEYFFVGETVELVATFTNGCADDITVQAAEGCFVDYWGLSGDDGTSADASVSCDADVVTLASGESVENRWSAGAPELGAYTGYAESTATTLSAFTFFTVQ